MRRPREDYEDVWYEGTGIETDLVVIVVVAYVW